jgi:hypothetical protein
MEVTVPHLWATVKAVSVQSGHLAVTVHIERAGGLEPVKVSQFDIAMRALGQLALRTKDAEPVLLQYHPGPVVSPAPMESDYVSVPVQGLDLNTGPSAGMSIQLQRSLAKGQSRLPEGTWLRYYLCTEVWCSSNDLRKSFIVPLLGIGMVQFERAEEQGGGGTVGAHGVTSDLRSEVAVPYLWATVESVTPRSGKTGLTVHLERGGLGPVRVSRSDLQRAASEVLLRTRDGDPVRTMRTMPAGALVVPAADPNDYVSVPDSGLDLTPVAFGETLYYWKSLELSDSLDRTFVLPEGSTLRYYLSSEVHCRSEDMRKAFYVPLMGVGLVQYGKKAE